MVIDIRNWQDIDSAWLEGVLAKNGLETRIADFTAKPVGTGQIGDCARFTLEYSSAPDNAPKSIVGKFPSASEVSRSTAKLLSNYYREVRFYQILQSRARISTPECYHTDMIEETHDFVLMMEDLSPAEQGDQLLGSTLEQTRLVLTEAAKLHSAYWNAEELDGYFWVQESQAAPNVIPPEMFADTWTGFKHRYGNRVSDQARVIGDALSVNLERYGVNREGNQCLIHTDFRPDNMLFATAAGGRPVTIVDWQSFAYGPPASDIGYFIAGALTPDARKTHEAELLDHYAQALGENGAGDYPFGEMRRHYVTGAYQLFLTAYFAAVMVGQTPRGDDMFFKMLNGAVELIFDHGAEDWLR